MREIVLDTETTGFEPAEGHRVIEIGCIELYNRIPTGEVYHVYINPARDVPQGAVDVHGLTAEFLADKPLFEVIARDFLEFVREDALIIHNAAFDIKFLNWELKLLGLPPLERNPVVDTLMMARRKHPGSPASLDALCQRYSIDNSKRTYHGALLDCELLAEVYIDLLGVREPGLSFDALPSRKTIAAVGEANRVSARTRPLAARITSQEMAAHRAFIESLGEKAIWRTFAAQTAEEPPLAQAAKGA